MEKLITGSVLILALFSLSGCGEPVLRVAGAGQDVRRGNYQEALAVYLTAAEKTKFRRVVEYNLGNVYYYLRETERALAMWESAAGASRSETAYRAGFNRGVVLYGLQEYEKAADAFLQALRLYPDRLEAKVNLEYCVRQMNFREQAAAAGDKRPDRQETPDKVLMETFMNIIRQQESTKWEQEPFTESAETESRDW
jgi:tetratricopeptide (TPR) repeat protein